MYFLWKIKTVKAENGRSRNSRREKRSLCVAVFFWRACTKYSNVSLVYIDTSPFRVAGDRVRDLKRSRDSFFFLTSRTKYVFLRCPKSTPRRYFDPVFLPALPPHATATKKGRPRLTRPSLEDAKISSNHRTCYVTGRKRHLPSSAYIISSTLAVRFFLIDSRQTIPSAQKVRPILLSRLRTEPSRFWDSNSSGRSI